MTTESRHRDFHEGIEREAANDVVQFLRVSDVEDADVGILTGDAPNVPPFALFLQSL
jgi:hypothetical protein